MKWRVTQVVCSVSVANVRHTSADRFSTRVLLGLGKLFDLHPEVRGPVLAVLMPQLNRFVQVSAHYRVHCKKIEITRAFMLLLILAPLRTYTENKPNLHPHSNAFWLLPHA